MGKVKKKYKGNTKRNYTLPEVEILVRRALKYSHESTMAIVCISLQDAFDFTNEEIQKLIEKYESNLECVEAKTVDVDDFINWYRKEIKEPIENAKKER